MHFNDPRCKGHTTIQVLCFILSEFRSGKSPLLVATDVASRGLGMLMTSFTRAQTAWPYSSSIFKLSFVIDDG